MTVQTTQGKAFEYACLTALFDKLGEQGLSNLIITEDAPYFTVKSCFHEIEKTKGSYATELMLAGKKLSETLIKTEPKLCFFDNTKKLTLSIQPDSKGQLGDVRDFIAVITSENNEITWQIGVSCKHNHTAVKHPRMSPTIDFGKEWLGEPLSNDDFDSLKTIFNQVDEDKKNGKVTWSDLDNKEKLDRYYKPLLNLVIDKIKSHPNQMEMSHHIISYLIGNEDFYKAIYKTGSRELLIQGFNFNGTLNLKSSDKEPLLKVEKLSLPNRVIDVAMRPASDTTLEIFFDKGWQVSMRIHNASKKLEQSLKMDVQLMGTPTLFTYSDKVNL